MDDFFPFFKKKMGFAVFLVHPPMASVLLSAKVERCFVSRMRNLKKNYRPSPVLSRLDHIFIVFGQFTIVFGNFIHIDFCNRKGCCLFTCKAPIAFSNAPNSHGFSPNAHYNAPNSNGNAPNDHGNAENTHGNS